MKEGKEDWDAKRAEWDRWHRGVPLLLHVELWVAARGGELQRPKVGRALSVATSWG